MTTFNCSEGHAWRDTTFSPPGTVLCPICSAEYARERGEADTQAMATKEAVKEFLPELISSLKRGWLR